VVGRKSNFSSKKYGDVNILNLKIQHLLPRDLMTYKSINTVCDVMGAVNYQTEFLNSLDLPGKSPQFTTEV
jgi:hypothetical protein